MDIKLYPRSKYKKNLKKGYKYKKKCLSYYHKNITNIFFMPPLAENKYEKNLIYKNFNNYPPRRRVIHLGIIIIIHKQDTSNSCSGIVKGPFADGSPRQTLGRRRLRI